MPRRFWSALCVLSALLVLLVLLGVRSYDWNVSALLHMDQQFADSQAVGSGVILYTDGGYDGMAYYQIARDIPAFFFGGDITFDSPYRFQRMLFPLLGFLLAGGNEQLFPLAFLVINLLMVVGACTLTVLITRRADVHALTVALNPAALVGILFTLTEPVSMFFLVLFLFLFERAGRQVTAPSILALTLSLFARETTIFFIALLLLWSILQRKWRDAVLLLAPVIFLLFWQHILEIRLGSVGFQANGNIIDPPFVGAWHVVNWAITQSGIERFYRLSSVAFLAFLLPLLFVQVRQWVSARLRVDQRTFLASGLVGVLFLMDSHMWGVITSIGRVVTPFYPVYALYASEKRGRTLTVLSWLLILVSVVSAVGIASQSHPYTLS